MNVWIIICLQSCESCELIYIFCLGLAVGIGYFHFLAVGTLKSYPSMRKIHLESRFPKPWKKLDSEPYTPFSWLYVSVCTRCPANVKTIHRIASHPSIVTPKVKLSGRETWQGLSSFTTHTLVGGWVWTHKQFRSTEGPRHGLYYWAKTPWAINVKNLQAYILSVKNHLTSK